MDFVLSALVTLVGLSTLLAYTWSLRAHFVAVDMTPGSRMIAGAVMASAALFLYLTWFHAQPLWAQALGLALQIGAGMLFVSAINASRTARLRFAFDPEHPHSLVENGPYRYIRHPFYTSYTLFWAGWAVATWSVWGLLSFAVLLALYIRAASMEERNFAASPLAETYAAYKSRTGFFWPRLG